MELLHLHFVGGRIGVEGVGWSVEEAGDGEDSDPTPVASGGAVPDGGVVGGHVVAGGDMAPDRGVVPIDSVGAAVDEA